MSIDDYACTLDGLTASAKDGRSASLDKCAWVQIAPCGCMNGVHNAVSGDRALMTAEQAMLAMADSKTEAARDAKAGFRPVLVLFEDYRTHLVELLKVECPHIPKWGYTPPSKTIGGITFIRVRDGEWRVEGITGVQIEKPFGRYWYLRDPNSEPSLKYVGRTITEARMRAAATLGGAR